MAPAVAGVLHLRIWASAHGVPLLNLRARLSLRQAGAPLDMIIMAGLRAIAPRLGALPPRLARARDNHGHSIEAEPWRKWYSLKRWKVLRLEVFSRDLFTCQMPGCGRIEGDTALLVCDHVERHGGDPRLFWPITNLQTLCKPCHDSAKQAEERRARHGP